jgi:hypothetical protein
MATSGSSGGCKKCTRKSQTPAGPPGSTVGHGNGSLWASTELLEMVVMNNFDGDLSSHCAEKVKEKIREDFNKALSNWANEPEISQYLCFDAQKPNPPCYELRMSKDYKIEVKCECNDEDLSQGKGPPSAKVSSNGMELEANPSSIPCNPPAGGLPDPPWWAVYTLYC